MVEVALLSGWLTPTSLFVLLNIVIGTILFSSVFSSHNNQNQKPHHESGGDPYPAPPPPPQQPQFGRVPSLLSRVTSFNFSNYYPSPYQPEPDNEPIEPERSRRQPHTELEQAPKPAPSLLSRVASFNFYRAAHPEPARPVTVTTQQKPPGGGACESRAAVAATKKKVVEKRDATVAKGGGGTASFGGNTKSLEEDQVDTKADDFINKFKQQLKMQRLESLLRYRNTATSSS